MRRRAITFTIGACLAALLPVASTAGAAPPDHARGGNRPGGASACAPADLTTIPQIQGSGERSPYADQEVVTEGIVTVDLQEDSQLRGFFLQDPAGDGDDATSDGIFVFHQDTGDPSFDPAPGDRVRVTGEVGEYYGDTQIDLTAGEFCGRGRPAVSLATNVTPGVFNADPEAHEGMFVRFTGPLTVTDTYNLHRFGEVWLADEEVVETPTNEVAPGPGAAALAEANMAWTVLLDDGSGSENPDLVPFLGDGGTLRLGDQMVQVTGAIQYAFGQYRVHPQDHPKVIAQNRRPAQPDVDGDVVVATANVLNYFTTLGERGASTEAQLQAQTDKLVAQLLGTGADVLALQEVENHPDHESILALRDALNAAEGADVWQWVGELDHYNTYPIRNEILFRSDRVSPVDDPVTIADPAFDTIPDGRDTPLGRPPVAQTFAADGQVFTVVNNHFKSKGCDGATGANQATDDGQSCFNATRVDQAHAVIDLVDALQAATDDPDVLVVGDLNAYLQEGPIRTLETELDNLVPGFDDDPYSYTYLNMSDAPWIGRGLLDHVLATSSLASQVVDLEIWHVNADEPRSLDWYDPTRLAPGPFRAADHDPIVVGLDLKGATPPAAAGPAPLDLDILHVNDHHSHLEEGEIDLQVGTSEVTYPLGGFPRVVSAIDTLSEELGDDANVVKIHAGDAITGTLYYTLFKGQADAALMNEVCFDVFALGNHEFDDGDDGLATFLDHLATGDCGTETLAANVVPELGTPLAPTSRDDYIQPFTVKSYDGQKVGFIGIDIAQKTDGSSQPFDTTLFLYEVATAQRYVDLLEAVGIHNIVLVTHQGYGNDLDLASKVSGVDVIVGGDSHSLLGDFAGHGLSPDGAYPTKTSDADGNRVCVVQAWEYSNVVGQLHVGFDADGVVTTCEGTPHLLVGEPTTAAPVATAGEPLRTWQPDPQATAVLAEYAEQVDVLAGEVIGQATEDICQARFPNDGRTSLCSAGNLSKGGEIQQLVTHAFLARAFRADIALQNSGGVRIDIPTGDITIARAYELLPFANTLYELEMTGVEIRLALEQGMDYAMSAGGSTGAFPYGSGIRWDLNTRQPFGERFSNIEVRAKGTDTWAPLDDSATYVVAANSFMAGGGDGYEVLADVVADGRGVDTFLDYAQSFIDYIVENAHGTITKPTEYSLKNYVAATS